MFSFFFRSRRRGEEQTQKKKPSEDCESPLKKGGSPEEEAEALLSQADECIVKGNYERALWLLKRSQHIFPGIKGYSELHAIAEIFNASSSTSGCSCSPKKLKGTDWYEILKIDHNSDIEVIKRRYRQLALALHPDKNKHAKAETAFKLVVQAYDCLSNNRKRMIFNLQRLSWHCNQCLPSKSAIPDRYQQSHDQERVINPSLQRPNGESETVSPLWESKGRLNVSDKEASRISLIFKAWKDRRSALAKEQGGDSYNRKMDGKVWPSVEEWKGEVLHEQPVRNPENFHFPCKTWSCLSSTYDKQCISPLHRSSQPHKEKKETYLDMGGASSQSSPLQKKVRNKDHNADIKIRSFCKNDGRWSTPHDGRRSTPPVDVQRKRRNFCGDGIWGETHQRSSDSIPISDSHLTLGSRLSHSASQISTKSLMHSSGNPSLPDCYGQRRKVESFDDVIDFRTQSSSSFQTLDSLGLQEKTLQAQRQKSEELLCSLEKLREEAKSIATTLCSLRQHVGVEASTTFKGFLFQKYEMTTMF